MIITDADYLIKLKDAKLSDKQIAVRLGIPVEEVERRWNAMIQLAEQTLDSGYNDLIQQFNVMAHQYQLVGESLKALGGALGNRASRDEIEGILKQENGDVGALMKNFIILKKFKAIDPQEAIEKTIQSN